MAIGVWQKPAVLNMATILLLRQIRNIVLSGLQGERRAAGFRENQAGKARFMKERERNRAEVKSLACAARAC